MKLLLITAQIVLIPASVLAHGWAMSKLWGWYVVPFGAPEIGVAWAAGLILLPRLATYNSDRRRDEDDDGLQRLLRAVAVIAIIPSFSVLLGWIIKGFM